MTVNKEKIISLSKSYAVVFALGIFGWEAYQFLHVSNQISAWDIVEGVLLFLIVSFVAIFSVSFFRGWIEF